ncbi:MAG TPA: Bcr/CflA family multidrug efflux MFS transporter [Methylomirabilota bacterium]
MAGARRPGTLALLLGSLTAFGPLSIDMYLPSFQAIARDLAASPAQVQLTLAVFFVALGIGQAFYGPVSDRYGRRRPLCFGLGLYVLASAVCALARSIEALVVWRFAQAIGGCAGMVIARAVVRDRFDEREAARFFSLLMLVSGLAPILAPSVGGQILVFFSWRAIFWMLAGFGFLCFVAVAFLLPESLPPERRAQGGVGEALRVYARLLRDRAFMRYALSGALVLSGMFAYIFGSPFVFMQIYGVRPERFGWIFGSIALGLISASQLNRVLLARVAGAGILSRALVVTAAAGIVLLIMAWTGAGGLPGLLAPLFVYIASLGFVLPNVIATALASQGRSAGTAAALLGILQFGAGAIVGMLLGALGAGTAVPMAALIAACGLSALVVHRLAAP